MFRLELSDGGANDEEGPDCDNDLVGVGGGLAMAVYIIDYRL